MPDKPNTEQIKAGRLALGLSQSAAARLIYVDPSTWAHWERGKTPMHRAFWELFLIKSGLLEVEDAIRD